MKKYLLIVSVFLFSVILVGAFLIGNEDKQETPIGPLIPGDELPGDEFVPETDYQLFTLNLGDEKIIDETYIFRDDELPRTVKFEDNEITIQAINIVQGVSNTGEERFSAYLEIIYEGEEDKIGFWHPTGEVYNEENGCLGQDNQLVCGGVSAVTTDKWLEEPTSDEEARGIVNVHYEKKFFLQEIDYDVSSDEWNYVKIVFALYRAERHPPTTT